MKSKNPGAPHSAESRREQRRQEASKRTEARAARTDEEQLALLAERRGESKRERARLERRKTPSRAERR